MIRFAFAICFLPCCVFGQSIALVDRGLKNAIVQTDTITVQQLSGKRFPVYIADLETVILITEQLARLVTMRTRHKPKRQIVSAGHTQFSVTTKLAGPYNTYAIFLSTRSGNVGATFDLVKPVYGNKKAHQQIQMFLDYLKNNRHIVKTGR